MGETWYRGQSTQAPPVTGSQVGGHDLGDGVYYTNDPKVAELYADTRVYKSGGQKQVVEVTIERQELGRVLDLTRDARWRAYLDQPGIRAAIKTQQNYPKLFGAFVAVEKINLAQYDVIIAEEFVRGGNQLCVRHQNGKPSAVAVALEARWRPAGQGGSPAPAPAKTFDITRLTFRPGTGPGNPAGFETYLRGRENRLNNTQAGWAMLGVLLGGAIQALGDVGIERQVRKAIEETHAATIRAIHERGLGALVIIRTKEWEMQDANGMRARALVEVRIQAGVSPEDALNRWQTEPQLFAGPGPGWRMRPSEFLWIG
ncbi:MAG: hypothetical protein JNK46_08045 [Methylobacteriaceae bacterium]|nr:hypothetical protein [Methylobacteriaceae bacterium]